MDNENSSGNPNDIAGDFSELVNDATDGSSPSDKDDLIDELERVYSEVGRLPDQSDIKDRSGYSASDYTDEFGSLDEAYTEAGIEKRKELLDELERVWKKQGKAPSKEYMNEHGEYSTDTYSDYFNSWKDSKEVLADERDVPWDVSDSESTFDDISEDGRIPEIRVFVEDIERRRGNPVKEKILKIRDIDGNSIDMCIWKKHKVQYEFHKSAWHRLKKARVKIFGDGSRKQLSSTKDLEVIKESTDEISKEDLLNDLRRLNNKLNKPPSRKDVREIGEYSVGAYKNRFGSMVAALEVAGIDAWRERYSKEDMLDDVRRVADELGRSPSAKDMRIHGKLSDRKYYQIFGSWEETLKQAGLPQWEDDFDEFDLIDEIPRVAEELDKVPTKRDMKSNSGLADYYDEYFGSWTDALCAAGYRVQGQQRERIPDQEIINNLENLLQIYDEINEDIVRTAEESKYHPQTYRSRFGSVEEARRMADEGQSDNESKSEGEIDISELKEKRVEDLVRLQPTSTRELADAWGIEKKEAKKYLWSELRPYSYTHESKSTGIHATQRAEDLITSNSENKTTTDEDPTDQDLIQELAELVRKHGEVTEEVIERESEFHPRIYRSRFGSIKKARQMTDEDQSDNESKFEGEVDISELKEKRVGDLVRLQPTNTRELADAWGIEKKEAKRYLWSEIKPYYETKGTGIHATRKAESLVKSNSENKTRDWDRSTGEDSTDEDVKKELVDEIERVSMELSKEPTTTEMDEHGEFSAATYSYYFDSWSDAMEKADLATDDQHGPSREDSTETPHSIPKDTWRGRVAQVLNTNEWKDAHDVSKEVTESEEIDKTLSKGGASSVLSDMYRNDDVVRREVPDGQTQYEYCLREDSN